MWDLGTTPRFSARTASIWETTLRSWVLTCPGKNITTSFFPVRISVPPTGLNVELSPWFGPWLLFSKFLFLTDALQNLAKTRIAYGFMRAACHFRMAHCSTESEWPSSLDLGQGQFSSTIQLRFFFCFYFFKEEVHPIFRSRPTPLFFFDITTIASAYL